MSLLHIRRAAAVTLLALLTALGAGLVVAGPASAVGTDRYVATDGNDGDNDCTSPALPCRHIGYAVNQSDNNDTIHIAAGEYDEAEIAIDINLTLEGATDGTTTVDGSGEAVFGVFGSTGDTTFAPTVTFKNMNISGNDEGEGVLTVTADVHFLDSHVDNNSAGGVVAVDSTIEASNSTFNGNGDAGESNPLFGSGLLVLFGAATVDHSTFDANLGTGVTLFPFDIFGRETVVRPEAANDAPVSVGIDHSTVSNNASGGVFGLFSSIDVRTSTVSGNTGFGIENAGGIADVENSTVTDTSPFEQITREIAEVDGAGIQTENINTVALAPSARSLKALAGTLQRAIPDSAAHSAPRIAHRIAAAVVPSDLEPGQTQVTGSIVAAQADGVPDCDGEIVDGGDNLSSDEQNSCGLDEANNDAVTADPLLGPLADNGGPTLTHLPAKGSPAIDAIPDGAANCDSEATDQREVSRPQGANCDIGAVEVDQTPIVIHPPKLPHGTVGEAYSVTITATGGLGPPYAISLVAGDLPPGLTFGDGAVISGTPTEAGRFPITVSVDDPVEKDYVIVIDEAAVAPTSTAAPTSSAVPPISNTGANTKPLTAWGVTGVLLGALCLTVAAWAGRERYRRAH